MLFSQISTNKYQKAVIFCQTKPKCFASFEKALKLFINFFSENLNPHFYFKKNLKDNTKSKLSFTNIIFCLRKIFFNVFSLPPWIWCSICLGVIVGFLLIDLVCFEFLSCPTRYSFLRKRGSTQQWPTNMAFMCLVTEYDSNHAAGKAPTSQLLPHQRCGSVPAISPC